MLTSAHGGRSFKELSESTGMKGGHLIFHLDQMLSTSTIVQDRRTITL